MQTLRRGAYTSSLIIAGLLAACAASPEKHTKRSPAARAAFMQAYPCPATGKTKGACPGYVVDHIVPIKRGGGDNLYNMQWSTVEEAKLKDRWE